LESIYQKISDQCKSGYPDIVEEVQILYTSSGTPTKLRAYIVDGSYLDIWLAKSSKYSYHWEQRHINGKLYRHDNAPHPKWSHVKTYPKHYHNMSNGTVEESNIPDDPIQAVSAFLTFIRESLNPL